ncbi:MAG: hypothetical protein ACPGXZ_09750, partial [Saprospiraceae bacterium]
WFPSFGGIKGGQKSSRITKFTKVYSSMEIDILMAHKKRINSIIELILLISTRQNNVNLEK